MHYPWAFLSDRSATNCPCWGGMAPPERTRAAYNFEAARICRIESIHGVCKPQTGLHALTAAHTDYV